MSARAWLYPPLVLAASYTQCLLLMDGFMARLAGI
jgi:hypothetical protein